MTALAADRAVVDRFADPLYTLGEASRFLGVSRSTVRSWARGYVLQTPTRRVVGRPIVTDFGSTGRRGPSLPFIGLAEAYALAAIRRAGVPLQRVRPALEQLDAELGLGHALASRRLYTDGAEVLYDYAQRSSADEDEALALTDLVVVRHHQRVFTEVVVNYLQRITFGSDGYALAVPLPGFDTAQVVADVRRGFGQPTFTHGGARLDDVLGLFDAGESVAVVAEEFGLATIEVEDALRNRDKKR